MASLLATGRRLAWRRFPRGVLRFRSIEEMDEAQQRDGDRAWRERAKA